MIKKIYFILMILFMVGLVSSADWTPQGNVNLRNIYNITNVPYYNGTDINITGLYYGNGSQLDGVVQPGDCPSGQFVQNTTISGVECAASAGSGDITGVFTTLDDFLYNGSANGDVYLRFNDTLLNNTIDDRDTDTTYTNGSGLSLIGTIFSVLYSTNFLGWSNLTDYPTACTSSQYISVFGDSLTCAAISITISQITDIANANVNSSNFWDGLNTSADITGLVDSQISDTLTIDGTGSVTWSALTSYPSACGTDETLTTVGDTLTCSSISILESQVSDLTHDGNASSICSGTQALLGNGTCTSPLLSFTESDPQWSGNSSTVARIGDCPTGQFVQNTTTGGVECAATAGSGDITAVNTADIYIYNGSTSGDVNLAFNETKLNSTIADIATGITNNTAGWTLNFSNIYSIDWTNITLLKSQLLNSGTLSFDWDDSEISDTLTIGSGSAVDKGALANTGTLGFDWVDSEIADTLTIDASSSVVWAALNTYPTTCTSSQYISVLGDIITCAAISITESQISDLQTYAINNTIGWTLNFSKIFSKDWTNITITENQVSDLTPHTTDTNASTACTGTTTYLDGDGACDDISSVYEVQLNNEAGLYAVLSDVTNFLQNTVEDTTPQLGGYLDTNGNNLGSTTDEIENVYVATNSRTYYGDGQEASIYYNGTVLIIG